MSEKLKEHPVIVYLVFVLPVLMFVSAMILGASVLVFLGILAWIGISFLVLFLPVSNDSGTSQ
jgi:hypothetical protein